MNGAAVALFSLEMPEDQTGMVALAKTTGISVNRQRRGDIEAEGHRALQEANMKALEKVCEVIVAKQRHGPCGTIELYNDQDTSTFGNKANKDGFR